MGEFVIPVELDQDSVGNNMSKGGRNKETNPTQTQIDTKEFGANSYNSSTTNVGNIESKSCLDANTNICFWGLCFCLGLVDEFGLGLVFSI